MDKLAPIAQAIEDAGGLGAFAAAVGEEPAAVNQWRRRNQVPVNKTLAVEHLTGVSRKLLRPNDWAIYWPEPVKSTRRAEPAKAA